MKMISLPNGKLINPAHIDSIRVHAHFLKSKKFYVQISLKKGSTIDIAERTIDIAERLDHEKALALKERYEAEVRDSYAEMDPYWLGQEDGCKEGRRVGYDEGRKKGYDDGYYIGRQEGYETGRTDGYETGQSDGYSSGYSAGMESHRETFLARIYGFHEELIREQRNARALTPDRRRYLRHSIDAITDLIGRLSPSVTDLER